MHLERHGVRQRLQVHVHRGKGVKDRYVPLPEAPLTLLSTYWQTHRTTTCLFPATGHDQQQCPPAPEPMSRHSAQGAFHNAKQRAGLTKTGRAIHALRHSVATQLSERGYDIRMVAEGGCSWSPILAVRSQKIKRKEHACAQGGRGEGTLAGSDRVKSGFVFPILYSTTIAG